MTAPDTPSCWKISIPCSRTEAEALDADNLFVASSDSVPTIVTRRAEETGSNDDDWLIEVFTDAKPDRHELALFAALAPESGGEPALESLADDDWVTLSQAGLPPVRAGRFHIHTSHDDPHPDPAIRSLRIEASRAFGTGHHETTTGCLRTLDSLKASGRRFRNIADVGTGTGLLAFAAQHLWPTARIIASDIDPVSIDVTRDNARINDIALGRAPGRIALTVSNGLDAPALQRRAPYDLIVANILAGPLVALAPQIAAASTPGGKLILAGLMRDQRADVERAYTRAGFALSNALVENEWPCLLFTRRKQRVGARRIGRSHADDTRFGEW